MTSAAKAIDLQSRYLELKVCKDQCEAQLTRMMADRSSSHGLLAMELAAIVRHDMKLRQLESDLRLMKVSVPAVDDAIPQITDRS